MTSDNDDDTEDSELKFFPSHGKWIARKNLSSSDWLITCKEHGISVNEFGKCLECEPEAL